MARWSYTTELAETGCHVTESITGSAGITRIVNRYLLGGNDRDSHNRADIETSLTT
jgi:hypothetical protein